MHRIILTLFVILVYVHSVFSSALKGTIADAETGESLVGVAVYIQELDMGTLSGLDGTYVFNDVPVGNYTLTVSYLGYTASTYAFSSASEGVTTVDIQLMPDNVALHEVTVSATGTKSTEASARESERNSVTIINVISARAIQISPDLDIASVVQRMSGITMESNSSGDAKYTLMRGMDKRYNYTLVNGVKIPSTNNKHRYISLDLFPSEMVDRVEVTKALTPDMEGDAIAGAVNLEMKDAPYRFHVQANVGAGFNFLYSDNPFLTFQTKVLHSKSPYELYGKDHYATPDEFPKENLDIKSRQTPVDRTAGLTVGNRFFRDRLGVMISGSYLYQYKGFQRQDFNSDVEKNDLATLNLPTLSGEQDVSYYESKENAGLHARLDYALNPSNSIKLYSAYIYADAIQLRESDNTNFEVSYDPANGSINRSHTTRFRNNKQKLSTTILEGEHKVFSHFDVNWSLVYSRATNATPDEASVTYFTNLQDGQPFNWFVDFDGSKRLWRHNTDQDKSAYLNLTYSLAVPRAKSAQIKFGGLYRNKTRSSFYNSYVLQAIVPVVTPDTSYTSFYAEKGKDWDTYTDINWRVYNPRGTIATGENFDSHENVAAGYGLFDIDFVHWQLVGGVRVEHTDQGYFMEYPIGQPRPDGKQVYTDVLPSLHVKYRLSPQQNLRLSYYKATNKAGFLEIVPCPVIDDNDNKAKGNPDLKRALADNIDLRWEYFPKPLDQILLGVFYKNIKDPIEYAYVKDGSSQDIYYSPVNSDRAINAGIELDIIKYFREFGVRANYTFTSSTISTPKLEYTRDENGDLVPNYDVVQERPLYGQSRHVANLSLLYKGANNNIDVQLAFSYTGDRIYTVSRFIDNDNWQKGFLQLDASVNKSFQNGLSLYLKLNNLLNTPFDGYIIPTNPYNDQFPGHDPGDKNTVIRHDKSSPSFLFGLRYNL